ncbi:probable receptor-like protein kinase At5g24010 [Aristolochia californica]|uniref:probable receptor-like protein kinase At5g24010 n=1 Tax=Aristolochia californica TaxID=171875 RepID=UPI0035E1291D
MANRSRLTIICFFLLQFLSISSASDDFRIDCGSNESTISEKRRFMADSDGGGLSLSTTSILYFEDKNPPTELPPTYRTARIFGEPSSYKFEIKEKGTHIVRLHFFAFSSERYKSFLPFSSVNYDLSSAVFDVSAMGSPLLKDFTVDKAKQVKEFIINIDAETFDLFFAPSKMNNSPHPLAFINAIEVLSAPTNFIPDSVHYLTPRGFKQFDKMSEKRLEIVSRINVGGPNISASNDTQGRKWIPDDDFLLFDESGNPFKFNGTINYQSGHGLSTQEIAPAGVYNTARQMPNLNLQRQVFNITWIFPVPLDRQYFIRLHFCDIISKSPEDLVFNVFINGQLAEKSLQPGNVTNQVLASPFYRDFVADTGAAKSIRVSVGFSDMVPNPSRSNGILNGVEIMAITDSRTHSKNSRKLLILIPSIVGGCLCVALLALTVLVFVKRRKQPSRKKETASTWKPSTPFRGSSHGLATNLTKGSSSPNRHLCLQISFAELKLATNNFDEKSVVGTGGFGKVYKGVLRDGTKVAVKRSVPGSNQGLTEFQAEIIILSKIRHRHLVSLVGYCEEESEMILVYEFVEKGPLKKHLYGSDFTCLSWEQRLEICIGAARGLHYLHTGSSQAIIHRDVKSSNILLDEDNLAMVADFGLSKVGPTFSQTHVSTAVKGSFGYLDPEYYKRHQLTEKSDVYSFGVVLLEVLCARPVVDSTLSNDTHGLAEWALKLQKKGMLETIVDARIKAQINSNSLRKFGETAARCLADQGVDRPTMGEVLWNLEYVMQLQRTVIRREPHEDSNAVDIEMPNVPSVPSTIVRAAEQVSDEITDFSTRLVFSQLVSNEGR